MQAPGARTGWTVAALVLVGAASGCNGRANPVQPSTSLAAQSSVSVGSLETALLSQASAGRITPGDLTDRGWTCFTAPVPNRIVCSRPNQGFPTVGSPPPEDRPATFTFFVFDGAGIFVGPEFLIRTDLYKGQVCESTGEPYVFVPVIGYYECVHPASRG
jgi:hypothetical protein